MSYGCSAGGRGSSLPSAVWACAQTVVKHEREVKLIISFVPFRADFSATVVNLVQQKGLQAVVQNGGI